MKKLFALILILSLVLSSLTGCFLSKKDDVATDGDKKDPIVADGSDNKGDEDPADDEAENPADEDGSTDGTGGTGGTGTNTGTNGDTNNGSTGGTDSGTAASGDWEDEDSTPTTPAIPTTPTPKPPTPPTTPPPTDPDVVTTASLVNTSAAFEAGISASGEWIVSVLSDIFFKYNISADGEFFKTGTTTLQRKIALYEQDPNRIVTAQYSLVAPSLTINSPNLSLTNGSLFGDLVAKGLNTTIVGTKIKGNVFVHNTGFVMKNGGKDTFDVSEAPEVSGHLIFMNRDAYRSVAANLTQPVYKVKGTIAVLDTETGTGASLTSDPTIFANALKADGEWIICGTADVTSSTALVLEGAMIKTGTVVTEKTVNDVVEKVLPYDISKLNLSRKIAMYEQAKYAFTGLTATINVPKKVFTLKAPSLTIKSPFARIQNSRFEGNLYIEATDFLFIDSNVIGNTYFASQAAYDGVKIDPVTRGKLLAPGNKVFVHNGTEYVEIPAAEFKAANTTDPQYLTLAPVDPATTVIINNNRP